MPSIRIVVIGCFCATLPNARVCDGFASDYLWSGSIEKLPDPSFNNLQKTLEFLM